MSKSREEKEMSQNEVAKVRERRYFSEEVRKHIVKEIDEGVYGISESARVYQVSQVSIFRWRRKYSLQYQKAIVKVVELESESQRRKALEKQLIQTQQLAGEQAVELHFFRKLVEIIGERYEFDFKKNINSMSFDGLEHTAKSVKKPD